MLWEWGAYLGQEALEQGVDVQGQLAGRAWRRTRCRRWPRAPANYANSALIKMEALADGYAEGIALDVSGNVSEGSGQNIFLVRDGVIYTPPLGVVDPRRHHARLDHDAGARPRLHGARGRCCRARRSTSPTRCSSSAPRPRSRRSGRSTRSRSATAAAARSPRRCSSAFFDVINGEVPDTHGWLTYVYPRRAAPAPVGARQPQTRAGR